MMIRRHDVGVYRLHFGTGPNFFLEENQKDAAIQGFESLAKKS